MLCLRLGSAKCKNSVVGKAGYQERWGANDELQGLSLRDNDCKPRFFEIGGTISMGVQKRGTVSHSPIFAAQNSLTQLSYIV